MVMSGKSCFGVFALLLTVIVLTEGSLVLYRLNTAICRTRCLEEFGPSPASQSTCESDPPCNMCWEVCQMLHQNFTLWGPMCNHTGICYPGCKTSCNYYNSERIHENEVQVQGDGSVCSFDTPLRLLNNGRSLVLHWSCPSKLSRQADVHLVYAVLAKGASDNRWREVLQTSDLFANIDKSSYQPRQAFRVLVISSHGQVASQESTPTPISSFDEMQMDQAPAKLKSKAIETLAHQQLAHAPKAQFADEWSPVLASLESGSSGVRADLSWPITHDVQSAPCKYEVLWQVRENSFEVTGKMYTERNFANITLWPQYSHSVQIRCFGIDGEVSRVSRHLYIMPEQLQSVSQSSFAQPCTVNNMFIFLLAAVGSLCLVLLVLVLFLACKNGRGKEECDEPASVMDPVQGDYFSYEKPQIERKKSN